VQVQHHNNIRANPRFETTDKGLLGVEMNRLYMGVWSPGAFSSPGPLLSIYTQK